MIQSDVPIADPDDGEAELSYEPLQHSNHRLGPLVLTERDNPVGFTHALTLTFSNTLTASATLRTTTYRTP
jgi:hypothetical protein